MPDATPRLHVETWAPEFGSAFEADESPALKASEIDFAAEVHEWRPMPGKDGDDVPTVAFIDGVRRVDARLTLDDPQNGPVPGICGSFAVGAVIWDRRVPRSEVRSVTVHRVAVLGEKRAGIEVPPLGPNLVYRMEYAKDSEPGVLLQRLQSEMRAKEGHLAVKLAQAEHLVIADGPIKALGAESIIGCVKRHRRSYVTGKKAKVVASLRSGERSPLFVFDVGGFKRYSWYLRLSQVVGGHSWSGIIRCECTASLPLPQVYRLADRTAAFLPRVASEQHLDPRAPQNLAPIAALERHLKRMLGDPGLVYRAMQAALHKESGPR